MESPGPGAVCILYGGNIAPLRVADGYCWLGSIAVNWAPCGESTKQDREIVR